MIISEKCKTLNKEILSEYNLYVYRTNKLHVLSEILDVDEKYSFTHGNVFFDVHLYKSLDEVKYNNILFCNVKCIKDKIGNYFVDHIIGEIYERENIFIYDVGVLYKNKNDLLKFKLRI